MKTKSLLSLAALLLLQCSCETAPTTSSHEFKRLSFDEFFARQVVSLPLSLEIPVQYVHAQGLAAPATYSYWMQANEVAAAAKSQDLPSKTGYIYGKLSLDVGFDRTSGRFTIEPGFEAQAAQNGMEIIEHKRFQAVGRPVLAYMLRAKNGNLVCSMYIATGIDSNAVYIAYRPPMNDVATTRVVWSRLVGSLR